MSTRSFNLEKLHHLTEASEVVTLSKEEYSKLLQHALSLREEGQNLQLELSKYKNSYICKFLVNIFK
jgi:hypothetical protein